MLSALYPSRPKAVADQSTPAPAELPPGALRRRPEDWPDIRWAAEEAPVRAVPLSAVKLSAGFPSPAADYEEDRLDINRYLMHNPVSTFFFPVEGDSMQGAEIFAGDILVVDKSVRARHGHIVVAFVNAERLVKRLVLQGGRMALAAENPAYPTLEITEEMDCLIWGVVIGKFKRLTY